MVTGPCKPGVFIMPSFPYKRIVVVGVTGSGKSTLAETLANKFGYDFIELDALHWEPNWTEAPLDVFRARVEGATASQCWVLAGNYQIVRDIVWSKAEVVVWLDYSFPLVFGRLWRRTWRRWWYQEVLWNGPLDRSNVLEEKTRVPSSVLPARTSTFELDTIRNSRRN